MSVSYACLELRERLDFVNKVQKVQDANEVHKARKSQLYGRGCSNNNSLRVVQGLLLVYDITDRNSYKMLSYWLERIRQVCCY